MVLRKVFLGLITALFFGVLIKVYDHTGLDTTEPCESLPEAKEGVYRGTARGFVSDIEVEVKFERSKPGEEVRMTRISVVSSREVKRYWDKVLEELKPLVLETQSTSVDAVTGATGSSRGFLEAVEDAKRRAYKSD